MSEPSVSEEATSKGAEACAKERLSALRSAGAEHWDGPGLRVVERLLAQAEHAPHALAEHLRQRALAHACKLKEDFAVARERCAHALEHLRAAEHPASSSAAEALSRGDVFLPRRLVRLAPAARPRLRDELRKRLAEQLDAQAEARGISSPGLIDAPVEQAHAFRHPLSMAQSLYRDAVAGASASITLAKTAASVPKDAGRYHPVHVAAKTLEEAARHPAYLKAVLARLETLGVLWHHGASAPASKGKRAESKAKKPATKR